MAWIKIPNEVVQNFNGRPMRAQRLDADLEPLYKPILCPKAGCGGIFTTLAGIKDHVLSEHDAETSNLPINPVADNEDATTGRLILGLIIAFNRQERGNPLLAIRKTNDSYHANEVWRRVQNAITNKALIQLKPEQHNWLESLLDRKLPLAKEARESGEEQQTVGMLLYGLSEDNVKQALTPLAERRVIEAEPDETPTERSGVPVKD